MDTLNGMRLFVRVADAKSFTKAAALASVTNAQLTRAIAELESRLRTRLLNRTTRRMSLTEAGERYLRRCEEILECVDLAESEARGASLWPSGRLRVHCSTGFGQHYLAPSIARYNREYPDVEIELVLAQRAPDMIEEGFDVSVVVSPELPSSSFVAQRIGSASIVLCASPTYLSARGYPGRLSDLKHHTCLQLAMPGSSAGQWVFDGPDAHVFQLPHRAAFTVNVAEALAGAVREGMGIGPLPLSVALQGIKNGTLVHVLSSSRLRPTNVYALYPSRRYLDAKIKTFVDFVRSTVPLAIAEQEREILDFGSAASLADGRSDVRAALRPSALDQIERSLPGVATD